MTLKKYSLDNTIFCMCWSWWFRAVRWLAYNTQQARWLLEYTPIEVAWLHFYFQRINAFMVTLVCGSTFPGTSHGYYKILFIETKLHILVYLYYFLCVWVPCVICIVIWILNSGENLRAQAPHTPPAGFGHFHRGQGEQGQPWQLGTLISGLPLRRGEMVAANVVRYQARVSRSVWRD
jgi:hypothetical protein